MELWNAIRERRSVGVVTNEPVGRETIEQLLEAGNWAPSHHATEPWRFCVMTGEGRNVLGEAYADIAIEQMEGSGETFDADSVREKQRAKAFRAPVVIAVAASPSSAPKVDRREELAAVHAAVQNMLLAAHALGLGAIWRSGEPMYHPRMKQALQLRDDNEMVALLYVGWPKQTQPPGKRRPASEKTTWLGAGE